MTESATIRTDDKTSNQERNAPCRKSILIGKTARSRW